MTEWGHTKKIFDRLFFFFFSFFVFGRVQDMTRVQLRGNKRILKEAPNDNRNLRVT